MALRVFPIGCLLLRGVTRPAAAESHLPAAGRWLGVNGWAVYNAGRSCFDERLADYCAVTDVKVNGEAVEIDGERVER